MKVQTVIFQVSKILMLNPALQWSNTRNLQMNTIVIILEWHCQFIFQKSTFEDRYFLSMLLEPRSLVLVCDDMYKVHLHGISERKMDTVTDTVGNIDVCNMADIGDTLHRETRISLTIRYVPKILKNKLFFGKTKRWQRCCCALCNKAVQCISILYAV